MRPIGREGGDGSAQRGRSLISTIALFFSVLIFVSVRYIKPAVERLAWRVVSTRRERVYAGCEAVSRQRDVLQLVGRVRLRLSGWVHR